MIKLEYFERKDFAELMGWIKDPELLMNWSGSLFSFPLTEASLEWYISDVNMPDADAFIYRAIDTENNKSVGHISIGGISKKNQSARITRVLIGNTADRGKGYCYQIVTAALKIAFEELKLHRVSLGVYDFNTSAIRCYQRAGMLIEGTQRDVLQYQDKWWSLVEMSMLEDEWKKLTKPD